MKYVEKLDGYFFLHWESLWPGVSRPVKLQFPDLQLGATQEGAWLVCRWAERTMLYSLALINRFIATTSQDCAPLC